jgi:hypothetical protein
VRGAGYTLLEASLVLAVLGLLAAAGLGALGSRGPALGPLALDLRGALDQAFLLARARGGDVRLGLAGAGGDVPPLLLPRGVRWGAPPGLPPPPGAEAPKRAQREGAAHPWVVVTSRGTATASAWYLTDGRDVLCARLSGQGQITVLRWRRSRTAWETL